MLKSPNAQNAACNAVVDRVDLGSTYSSGRTNLYNSDSTHLAILMMSYPAYGDATDGTAIANTIYDATVLKDGTAALFDVSDRDASAVWNGTVSTYAGLGDWKLNSIILYKDSTVGILNGYYAVPR